MENNQSLQVTVVDITAWPVKLWTPLQASWSANVPIQSANQLT